MFEILNRYLIVASNDQGVNENYPVYFACQSDLNT